jgi:hypothetical protein
LCDATTNVDEQWMGAEHIAHNAQEAMQNSNDGKAQNVSATNEEHYFVGTLVHVSPNDHHAGQIQQLCREGTGFACFPYFLEEMAFNPLDLYSFVAHLKHNAKCQINGAQQWMPPLFNRNKFKREIGAIVETSEFGIVQKVGVHSF